MRHLDLFSGIGGFSLAAQWCWGSQHEIVLFIEKDTFCQKVLAKHWPTTPIHDDIHTFNGRSISQIDLLTGGFPCQPFSLAGRQTGVNDDRYLWPEMVRIIAEAKPHWVVAENVRGIIGMALDTVLADLERKGYEAGTIVLPACATNAPHRRDRVWIIAHANGQRCQGRIQGLQAQSERRYGTTNSYPAALGFDQFRNGLPAPTICRANDGLPNFLDRLRSLGNAIVPQVAYELFRLIDQVGCITDTAPSPTDN